MKLQLGDYELLFSDGGVQVRREGETLYFNRRPVYVSVKTEEAMLRFRDIPYDEVAETGSEVCASARFVTGSGSILRVEDRYARVGEALRIGRSAVVIHADSRDLGFQTKISFCQSASNDLADFEYFSPGQ